MWSNNVQVLVLATLALCLLSLAPQPTNGLKCIPCPTDLTLLQQRCGPCPRDCKYGIIKDICNCCRVCGQGPGESCMFQVGVDQCGTGLICTQQNVCVPLPVG